MTTGDVRPDPETVEALVTVFQRAWHAADERGESGARTEAGIRAVLAAQPARDPLGDDLGDSLTYCGAEFGETRDGECECPRCLPARDPLGDAAAVERASDEAEADRMLRDGFCPDCGEAFHQCHCADQRAALDPEQPEAGA